MSDPSGTNSPLSAQSTNEATTQAQPSQSTHTSGLFQIPPSSFKSTGFGIGFGSNANSFSELTGKPSIFGGSFNKPAETQANSESNLPAPGGGFTSTNIFQCAPETKQDGTAQSSSSSLFGDSSIKAVSPGIAGKPSIFGGIKSDEMTTAVKPNIWSGIPPTASEDGSMSSKSSIFGNTSFKHEEPIASVKPSIFGGIPLKPQEQQTLVKPTPFDGTPMQPEDSTRTVKPSIFGGASSKPESVNPFKPKIWGGGLAESEGASSRHVFGSVLRTVDSTKPGNLGDSGRSEGSVMKNNNIFGNKAPIFGGQPSGANSDFKSVIQFSSGSETKFGTGSSKQNLKESEGTPSSHVETSASTPNVSSSFQIPAVPGCVANTGSNFVSSTASGIFSHSAFGKTSSNMFNSSVSTAHLASGPSKNIHVSSTVSQSSMKKDSKSHGQKDVEKDEPMTRVQNLPLDQDEDYEENEYKPETDQIVKPPVRVQKGVRKRSVFARAIQDASKSLESTRGEDLKSIYFLIDDALNDRDMLRKHFSKFGKISRLTLNTNKKYCNVSYKSPEEAQKAMEMGKEILGTPIKFFWRNPPRTKRKSQDEPEKMYTVSEYDADGKLVKSVKRREIDTTGENHLDANSEANRDHGDNGDLNLSVKDLASRRSRSVIKSEVKNETKIPRTGVMSTMDESVREELAAMADVEEERPFTASLPKTTRLRRRRAEVAGKQVKLTTRKSGKEFEVDDNGEKGFGHHASSKAASALNKVEDPEDDSASIASESAIASTDGASELLAIMRQPAISSEERLRVLEARDKLIRLRRVKQTDLSKAVKTVGTCPDMCPEKERLLRETRRQISQYEMSKNGQMDPRLMVKQYSRSSADQEEPLPHELRPPLVMTMTMNYLLHCIMDLCDQPGENLAEWYHFLWDRTRGIRKEITQQELCDLDAVRLVEQCARFHIHCCARLVSEDMSVFDDRINTENLTKCLQTLKHMYHDLWIHKSITCTNEPEFITYFLLLNLNNGTIMWELEQLREEVLNNPAIGFAASLYNSLNSNNFVRFFRLVRKASYLDSCLCIRYFYQVRSLALRTLVKALAKARPVAYPVASLVKDLGFENVEEAAVFCSQHGLQIDYMRTEASSVILSSDTLSSPSTIPACNRALNLVESKKMGTVGEVVYGGSLPPRNFESHVPHNSFDSNNIMQRNSWSAKDQGQLNQREEDLDLDEEMQALDQIANKQEEKVARPENASSGPQAHLLSTSSPSTITPVSPFTLKSAQGFGSLFDTTPKSTPSVIMSGSFMPKETNRDEDFSKTATPPSSVFSRSDYGPFSQPMRPPAPASKFISWTIRPATANVTPSSFQLQPSAEQQAQQQAQVQAQQQAQLQAQQQAQLQAQLQAQQKAQQQAQLQAQLQAQQQAQQKAEAERKAKEELEKSLTEQALKHSEDIITLIVNECSREEAEAELKAAQAELEAAEEKEMRRRVLDSQLNKASDDSFTALLDMTVHELVREIASDILKDEFKLQNKLKQDCLEIFENLFQAVVQEECENIAKVEMEEARREALKQRVSKYFHHWLSCARRSLRMRQAMQNFPAGVMHLSLKEHAERWGYPVKSQLDVWKGSYGRNEKALDIPELKAPPAFPQTTLAEMIGVIAVHHYDSVRCQLGLYPTDQVLFKVVVSVPEDEQDRGAHLTEWWMRRALKQRNSMRFDDKNQGILRYVSGQRVTPDVVVFTSLQLVRGMNPILKSPSLIAGTSAVLFILSPDSDIEGSRSRLSALLKAVPRLPPPPLVVGVVCPLEPPVEALKRLVAELELDQWLMKSVIRDYQILHVRECTDLEYITERLKTALSYTAMMWTPVPQLDLVQLRSILKSTFQMFCISAQFNYNSSEIYPQDINDPRVIIGLVNEWLDLMLREFLSTLHEANELCAGEFWPLLHKGAYLPFHHHHQYEEELIKVMAELHIPEESTVSPFDNLDDWFKLHTKWLKPEDQAKTFKRLSCVDRSLSTQDQLSKIPWMQIIEDWMEARLHYVNTTQLCNKELMVLVCASRVEELYTTPWWSHSKHIQAYLESHRTGRENDMELDQTVPLNDSLDQTMKSLGSDCETSPEKPPVVSKLEQLYDMASGLNKLKEINSSLTERIKAALNDDQENLNPSNMVLVASTDVAVTETIPKIASVRSLIQNIDTQLQVQRNVNSNVSLILSDALASDASIPLEEHPVTTPDHGDESEPNHTEENATLSGTNHQGKMELKNIIDREETSEPSPSPEICDSQAFTQDIEVDESDSHTNPRKMEDIMSSMRAIMSSLSQRHGVPLSVPANNRMKSLLLGTVPGDRNGVTMPYSELQRSSFIEGSQQRMAARLHRFSPSHSEDKDKKRSREDTIDHGEDLEVVFDTETSMSPHAISDNSKSPVRESQYRRNSPNTKRPRRERTTSPETVEWDEENSKSSYKHSENSASAVYTEDSPSPLSDRSFHSDEYVRSPTSEEDNSCEASKELDDNELVPCQSDKRQGTCDVEVISSDSSRSSEPYSSERGSQSDHYDKDRHQRNFRNVRFRGQAPRRYTEMEEDAEIEEDDDSSTHNTERRERWYHEVGEDDDAFSGVENDDVISGLDSGDESSYEERVVEEPGRSYTSVDEEEGKIEEVECEDTEDEGEESEEEGSAYSELSEEERGTRERIVDCSKNDPKDDSDECEVILDDDD